MVALLNRSLRAFVHVFCPYCGGTMTFTEDTQVRYCGNIRCPDRGTAYKVLVKVIRLIAKSDERKPLI